MRTFLFSLLFLFPTLNVFGQQNYPKISRAGLYGSLYGNWYEKGNDKNYISIKFDSLYEFSYVDGIRSKAAYTIKLDTVFAVCHGDTCTTKKGEWIITYYFKGKCSFSYFIISLNTSEFVLMSCVNGQTLVYNRIQ